MVNILEQMKFTVDTIGPMTHNIFKCFPQKTAQVITNIHVLNALHFLKLCKLDQVNFFLLHTFSRQLWHILAESTSDYTEIMFISCILFKKKKLLSFNSYSMQFNEFKCIIPFWKISCLYLFHIGNLIL